MKLTKAERDALEDAQICVALAPATPHLTKRHRARIIAVLDRVLATTKELP